MTEIQRRKEEAAATALRRRAGEIESAWHEGVREIRDTWIRLAAIAWEIKQERLWRAAQFQKLSDFVEARLDVRMRYFEYLVELHEEFVVRRNTQTSALSGVDVTKAVEVLPAIRDGRADVEDALEDARELTVRELREKYAKPKSVAPPRQNGKPEQEPEEPRRVSPPERVDEAEDPSDAPPTPAEPSEPEQIRCPTCGQLADPDRVAA